DDLPNERVAVCDGCNHVEAVVAQQPRQPVAQQREVFGDHYSHGSSVRTVVGPPWGLSSASVPSRASTRRFRPCSPEPVGSAPPTPLSTTATTSRSPLRTIRISTRLACACFAAFASASATTK